MPWYHYASYILGGAFLTNSIPHFVSGIMGRAFQSPFAKPPGKGLSSSLVNVLWGAFNITVGYCLIFQVGNFDLRIATHAVALGSGMLLMAMLLSHLFGPIYGGDLPQA